MVIAHAHRPNPSTSDCIGIFAGSPTSQITNATSNNIEDLLRMVLFPHLLPTLPKNSKERSERLRRPCKTIVGAKFELTN
jgi:hypothetical protein